MARQGDVLVVKIDKIPEDAKLSENKTIAYGEVSGHYHTFQGSVQLFRKSPESICKTGQYAVI